MRHTETYYHDQIESIKIDGVYDDAFIAHDVEFINAGDEQIGIRLDGILRYFSIRGCKACTIKPTRTGISIYQNASVMGFVRDHADSDALWLAMAAHKITKPIRRHVFETYVYQECPELA